MKKNKAIRPDLRFPEFQRTQGWSLTTIGELGSFYYGKSAPKWSLSEDAPTPCVRYGELYTKFGTIIKETFSRTNIDPEKLRFSKGGEILIPRVGEDPFEFSKCSYLPFPNVAIGEMISVYETEEDSIFYAYYFGTLSNEFAKVVEGQNVKNLYYVNLEPIEIGKPVDLAEQKKIASCLSSLDELIISHSEKLKVLVEHKKALMQQLFPETGSMLPSHRFSEFKDDGDWIETPLIETADKNIKWSFTGGPFGSNLKASDYTKEGIRIIQLQNIGDGEFNNKYKIYTSLEKADELLSCNIYSGDIIISKMGDPVGRSCIIPEHLKRCVMASDGIRLVVDEVNFSKYFIYSLINSKRIRNAIQRKATGSTRRRIGLNDLKQISLIIPPTKEEQQTIANCLIAIDNLIMSQEMRIEHLQGHKKGLMQSLFPTLKN